MIYRNNIAIPTICPLEFYEDGRTDFGFARKYVQIFNPTDTLHVQFMSDNDLDQFELNAYLYSTDILLDSVYFVRTLLSTSKWYFDANVSFATIYAAMGSLPFDGGSLVEFRIENDGMLYAVSRPVDVSSHIGTVKIRYHSERTKLQTVFGTFNEANSFSIRVGGGFIPSFYEIGGDYDTFNDSMNQPTTSYFNPQDKLKLTLGDAYGLPDWMVRKLSYIFGLDIVLIDGVQYVRIGEIESTVVENTLNKVLGIMLVPKTNRQTQNITGDTYITDESGNVLTDELGNLLTMALV